MEVGELRRGGGLKVVTVNLMDPFGRTPNVSDITDGKIFIADLWRVMRQITSFLHFMHLSNYIFIYLTVCWQTARYSCLQCFYLGSVFSRNFTLLWTTSDKGSGQLTFRADPKLCVLPRSMDCRLPSTIYLLNYKLLQLNEF